VLFASNHPVTTVTVFVTSSYLPRVGCKLPRHLYMLVSFFYDLLHVSYTLTSKAQFYMKNVQNVRDTLWHYNIQCESKKILPPRGYLIFFHFFHERLRIFNWFFTHLLHVPMYTRLQIFIQLSPTLTKLCHIKCDYLVHIMCEKCPPLAKMHAFRRLR